MIILVEKYYRTILSFSPLLGFSNLFDSCCIRVDSIFIRYCHLSHQRETNSVIFLPFLFLCTLEWWDAECRFFFFIPRVLVARVCYCLFFVCLEFQIIRFVISTFTPIFFIEISFVYPPPPLVFLFHLFIRRLQQICSESSSPTSHSDEPCIIWSRSSLTLPRVTSQSEGVW